MFSNKDKKPEKNKIMERNVIAKNTTIVGDIKSDGDFRIDGSLEGTLLTKGRVIIGVDGLVEGKIEVINAEVEGKFSGDLIVSDTLTIKATANISGNVTIGKLSAEPGALFNATCVMKGSTEELNSGNDQKKSSKRTA